VADVIVLGWRNRESHQKPNVRRKCTVVERESKNWRELCNAALGAKDPDELLKIVQELNQALKREEQVRRDFREAMRANKASA
jgi:hypothetical protein